MWSFLQAEVPIVSAGEWAHSTFCYSISYKELAAKAAKFIFLNTARMCGESWYLVDVCHFIGGSGEEVVVIRTDTGLDEEGTTFMALITVNWKMKVQF